MKYSTAVKLVDKMEAGQTVKIRKSKYGEMSSVSWEMICNVFFYRGSGEQCLSAKIILF